MDILVEMRADSSFCLYWCKQKKVVDIGVIFLDKFNK